MQDTENTQSEAVISKGSEPSFNLPKTSNNKFLLAVGMFIALVGAVYGGQYIVRKQIAQNHTKHIVCSDALIQEASPNLRYGSAVKLKPTADKVKAVKNFEQDPNCLYITLTYALVTDNLADSKAQQNKLEKVYNPKVGFSNLFSPPAISIDDLRKRVNFLEKQHEEFDKNSRIFNGPPLR